MTTVIYNIQRRNGEMQQMLELGRVLYINLPSPQLCVLFDGSLVNLLEYFTFVRMITSIGSGNNIDFRGVEPFTSFWDKNKESFTYQAYFKEIVGQPLFFIHGSPLVIGSYLKVAKGHIVFIPVLNAPGDRFQKQKIQEVYIDSLINLTAELQKTPNAFELPEWSKSYILPEEFKQKKELFQLEEELNTLMQRIDEQKSLITQLEANKILFTGKGRILELQIKKIFEELGFTVSEGEPGRDDLILQYGARVAVVEIKGVDRKSAAEGHARQLEQWVSTYDAAHEDVKAKGILIVNAFKDIPLQERNEAPFPNQMLPYSVKKEHCLMTGLQLLGLYLDCKDNEEKKREVIERIFITDGVFTEYQDWTSFLITEDTDTIAVKYPKT